MADYAGMHDDSSWDAVANSLFASDCEVEDTSNPGLDVVTFTARCPYHSIMHLVFDGLLITTDANAALVNPPLSAPAPTP